MGRRLAVAALLALSLAGCAPTDEAATASAPPTSAPASGKAPKEDISVNPHGNMALPTKKM